MSERSRRWLQVAALGGAIPHAASWAAALLGACTWGNYDGSYDGGAGGPQADGEAGGGMDATDASPDDGGSGPSSDVILADGSGGDGGSNACAAGASRYIYAVSDAGNLYTFDPTQFPSASAFTLVGTVPCVPSRGYVNSMAVDRQGNAYLNMQPDGSIWKMTTVPPLVCTRTGFVAGQAGFTTDLGMAFSADAPGSPSETLYVSDSSGPGGDCTNATPSMAGCWGMGLGVVDVTSWRLAPLGGYTSTAAGYNAALTGTPDGKLYGFFTGSPSSYGPIDKANGHTDTPPPTTEASIAVGIKGHAFSFWGGDFYFFTATATAAAPTGATIPQSLSVATGTVTSGDPLGFVILAAGSSTCAPAQCSAGVCR